MAAIAGGAGRVGNRHSWAVPAGIRTGLCSVTLRTRPADEVVAITASAGLEAIEWGADIHVPPGAVGTAESVRTATEAAGLRVASYGSYYRAGYDDPEAFEAVLASARALGAPRVRVWAGATASGKATAAERLAVISATRRVAERAAAAGIEVGLEFHGDTLTDEVDSALGLLGAVAPARAGARVTTYWQPPEGVPGDEALAGLRRLLEHVTAVHVFSWWPGRERRRLAVRERLWRAAFELLAAGRAPVDALLEFVPGDDPRLVAGEARTLGELVKEPYRGPA
jgi:3-dehydroshikimate dehydratase